MSVIDEVNGILGNDFEIFIGTIIQKVGDPRLGERKITLIDKKGIFKPIEYKYKSDTFDVEEWFDRLSETAFFVWEPNKTKRLKLLLQLFNKVKRIRKINKLLNEN